MEFLKRVLLKITQIIGGGTVLCTHIGVLLCI